MGRLLRTKLALPNMMEPYVTDIVLRVNFG